MPAQSRSASAGAIRIADSVCTVRYAKSVSAGARFVITF
jgi:hypothetical protein